jgi:hypothetical protein
MVADDATSNAPHRNAVDCVVWPLPAAGKVSDVYVTTTAEEGAMEGMPRDDSSMPLTWGTW